jgi:hypothetical protein
MKTRAHLSGYKKSFPKAWDALRFCWEENIFFGSLAPKQKNARLGTAGGHG